MNETRKSIASLQITDRFPDRHIGPGSEETKAMLDALGYASLEALVKETVPTDIQFGKSLALAPAKSEVEALKELKSVVAKNKVFRSYLGMGYHGTVIPGVIQRNILENPGWYTQYTPYQAEIAQGRLEALLNFQTMVGDLTGMEISNASLLDEGTAAAEAMAMCHGEKKNADTFFVASDCHPQTIAVVKTRAEALGIKIEVGEPDRFTPNETTFGCLLQYPGTDGTLVDYTAFVQKAHAAQALVVVAADLLALAILKTPGEMGADIAVGNTQRFGVPLGFGGPHAAYLATHEKFQRRMPGRIVGVSRDRDGKPAIRLALQTREQHIRRDKATSNICTAQVLLAIMSGMYAVYHGPRGIRKIAERVNYATGLLAQGLRRLGYTIERDAFFDTVRVGLGSTSMAALRRATQERGINVRELSDKTVTVSLDETVTESDLHDLLTAFAVGKDLPFNLAELAKDTVATVPGTFHRKTAYLTHPVFNTHHSETQMLRYIRKLETKDLSLTTSMIPLGSCTMKLNATAELYPVSWPEINAIHPFAPNDQTEGYREMLRGLEDMLKEVTGFAAVSLQPNAGSQGEYAGLLVIRKYHQERGQGHRTVCLIPQSAHGTNPASAVMAGMKVVGVKTDPHGNIDVADLEAKAKQHAADLSALMVTYPSTHGVFEATIRQICTIIHANGGQVYMDGANMNAQVGLCRPGDFGPDVIHLNLHKTFCIPHGGGGPGMGPIAVASHLAPFLPSHPVVKVGGEQAIGPVSAAPWGSPSILPISWMYIRMMGAEGLTRATQLAILNANYIAKRLDPYFPVLYKGKGGLVAHECIIDLRDAKKKADVEVEDIAKRLMDYGFHAPTVSWPVPGTMMIEPTESEAKGELDRFCDALIAIHGEVREIERGEANREDNVLKNAPHTAEMVVSDGWSRPYSREKAAYPAPWCRERKFWPPVRRIDNVWGDRNLFCSCLPVGETLEE